MGIFKLLLWVFYRGRWGYDTRIYPLVSHDVYSNPSAAYIRSIPVQQNRPPRNRDPIYRIDVNFINSSRMVAVDYPRLDMYWICSHYFTDHALLFRLQFRRSVQWVIKHASLTVPSVDNCIFLSSRYFCLKASCVAWQ